MINALMLIITLAGLEKNKPYKASQMLIVLGKTGVVVDCKNVINNVFIVS